MRFPDEHLPYTLAQEVFAQGVECDNAARILRAELPAFFKSIAERVRADFATGGVYGDTRHRYMKEKERPWLVHYAHGKDPAGAGADDPDCPCRGTRVEWECAYQGCGFCRAAQAKREEESGGA